MTGVRLDVDNFDTVVNYGKLMRTQLAMNILVKALQEIANGESADPSELALSALREVAKIGSQPLPPEKPEGGNSPTSGPRKVTPTDGSGKVTSIGRKPTKK